MSEHTPPPEPRARRWTTVVSSLVAFAACYMLTCLAIGRTLDSRPESRLEEPSISRLKYKHFAREKDSFDLVFIGSSRLYRQFSPAIFDKTLRDSGHRLRSFNFGLAGMRHHEISHTVRWILDQSPARLKWLVIEPLEINEELILEHMTTYRAVNWHSPRTTYEVCRSLLHEGLGPLGTLHAIGVHLNSALLRAGNFGTATSFFKSWAGVDRQPNPKLDGFFPLDMQADLVDEEWQKEIERAKRLREDLEDYRFLFFDSPDSGDAATRWLVNLSELGDEIRAQGVDPVFIIAPPTWDKMAGMLEAGRNGSLSPMFSYHDLREHPEFYRIENLFNLGHLNSKGSRLLTIRFARDFARFLSEREDN